MTEQEFFDHLHQVKYREENESFEAAMIRLSTQLSPDGTVSSEVGRRLFEILIEQRFLPAGRVQSNIGTDKETTAINCFLSGVIDDHLVGPNSIMDRAEEAAKTMKMGGGIGYDFSTLRPKGAEIETLKSASSGPVSFMEIYNAIGLAISSAGHRRGAQMGVMRVDHPDIVEFVRSKQNTHRLNGFNISVGITDEFMNAVEKDEPFDLLWDHVPWQTIEARELWDMIMESTYDYAEPGVIFLDTINRMNNLYYCETITATNPCGEQPLPPYGACLLGSFNLTQYTVESKAGCFTFDHSKFSEDVSIVVAAMDKVVDISKYPLEKQREEEISKRRMGLGVTGVANALERMGLSYGSYDFCIQFRSILENLRDVAYASSVALAKAKKAPFPAFERDLYLRSSFVQQLPSEVKRGIAKYGIRNSHLTSIAPTGTISMAAGNISSGIEPVFAHEMSRKVFMPDEGQVTINLRDYGYREWGNRGKTMNECSVEDHLRVLQTTVPYVDSASSKTVNIPSDLPFSRFKDVYSQAFRFGAKGVSTFRVGGKRKGILEEVSLGEPETEEGASCRQDEATGKWTCD